MIKLNKKIIEGIICCIPLIVFIFYQNPPEVDHKGWILFGIFCSTILAFILKPIPIGQVSLISLTLSVFLGVIDGSKVFNGFSSSITWLIVSVFFIAQGVINTGLSKRMAYIFIKLFGKNCLGLAYSIVITDFIISPCIPTAGAKTGSIVLPIIDSIIEANNSKDANNSKYLREFLLITYSHTVAITSSTFLIGTATSAAAIAIAKTFHINISWLDWFVAAIVPSIVSLIVIPICVYLFYKNKINIDLNFQHSASDKLSKMGKPSSKEKYTIFVMILLLVLWITQGKHNINNSVISILGVNLMMLRGIISFQDVVMNKNAWNTFIWFGVIIMLSDNLYQYKIMNYFGNHVLDLVSGVPWYLGVLIISVIYFYSHYFFAGGVTHTTGLYAIFFCMAVALGAPPIFSATIFAFLSNLFSALTHYASISSAILFEASNMSSKKWCKYSLLFSTIILIIWVIIGSVWWSLIGLY